MSKKQVALTVGLAVLATPALATKARVHALGQDTQYGSFYIQDTRDVFYNPAHVTTHKDYVVMEFGDATGNADSTAAPRPEAGFFRGWGNFAYGVYFGNDYDPHSRTSIAVNSSDDTSHFGTTTILSPDNRWEIFFGGDSGIQWGAKAYFNHAKTNGNNSGAVAMDTDAKRLERKTTAYGLSLGAVVGNIEAYGHFDIHDESEGAVHNKDNFDADLGYKLGAKYAWHGWTFAGDYSRVGYEFTEGDPEGDLSTDNDNFTKRESNTKAWWLGAGRTNEINDKARFFADLKYTRSTTEDRYARLSTTDYRASDEPVSGSTRTSRPTKVTTYTLPVTLGIEADATSWLTLRGSATQNVWSTSESAASVRTTAADSITVRAGATLNFGQLKLDGIVANDANGDGSVTNSTDDGILRLDNIMSRVAMHYWF